MPPLSHLIISSSSTQRPLTISPTPTNSPREPHLPVPQPGSTPRSSAEFNALVTPSYKTSPDIYPTGAYIPVSGPRAIGHWASPLASCLQAKSLSRSLGWGARGGAAFDMDHAFRSTRGHTYWRFSRIVRIGSSFRGGFGDLRIGISWVEGSWRGTILGDLGGEGGVGGGRGIYHLSTVGIDDLFSPRAVVFVFRGPLLRPGLWSLDSLDFRSGGWCSTCFDRRQCGMPGCCGLLLLFLSKRKGLRIHYR